MIPSGAVAALALLATSCAHRTQTGILVSRHKPVQTTMQRQVQNAVDAGDGDAVARDLRQRMTADPGNLAYRLELAGHYRQQGYTELAIEHYRLAADRFPQSSKVVLLLVQAMHEQHMTAEAAALLDRFLSKHPAQTSDLPAWLGILRDETGDYARGESAHRAAVALSPSNAKLHNNLGYNLLIQGKRPEAVEALRRALALDPHMETASNNLGRALMSEAGPQQRREAIAQWKSAANAATAHNNAAAILIEQGDYAEARRELEAALREHRNFLPALKNLELVSQLDAKPAAVLTREKKAAMRRSAVKVWNAVAGIEEKPRKPGVTLATRE